MKEWVRRWKGVGWGRGRGEVEGRKEEGGGVERGDRRSGERG